MGPVHGLFERRGQVAPGKVFIALALPAQKNDVGLVVADQSHGGEPLSLVQHRPGWGKCKGKCFALDETGIFLQIC